MFLLYKVINYPLQLTQLPKNNEGMLMMNHTYIILMATQRDSPSLSRSGGRVYQWGLQGALTTMFKNLLGACLRRLFLLCSAYLLCVCMCVCELLLPLLQLPTLKSVHKYLTWRSLFTHTCCENVVIAIRSERCSGNCVKAEEEGLKAELEGSTTNKPISSAGNSQVFPI